VRDLLAVPRDLLVQQFGDHMDHLLALAQGRDDREVIPAHEAKSIGNETTFAENIADPDQLQDILDYLADKVARRVRNHGFRARTITLKARYGDFTTFTRSATLPEATDSTVVVRDTARNLLQEKLGRRGRALRLIGVTASGLQHAEEGQGQLFADPARIKNEQLDRLMDQVHDRYGPKLRRGLGRRKPRD
jgi:DNA polymerase-4